jgi:ferritin
LQKLIDDSLVSALLEQWVVEKDNASIYLFISGDLKNRGFDALAEKFKTQYDEENSHSQIIFDLLTDLNAPIILPEIDAVNIPINTIVDIAQKFLDREIHTTNSLDALKKLAIDNNNPVVEERIREMLKLQQKEYEEATTFMDRAELCGSDWFKVMIWDLGEK